MARSQLRHFDQVTFRKLFKDAFEKGYWEIECYKEEVAKEMQRELCFFVGALRKAGDPDLETAEKMRTKVKGTICYLETRDAGLSSLARMSYPRKEEGEGN